MKVLPSLLTLWLLTNGIGTVAPPPPDEKGDKAQEAKKLQGTWKIVSAEFSGKRGEVKDIGIDRIVVAGEKMTLKNGDKEVATYTFELYPDRKPKGLLWKKKTKEGTGLLPAIYQIDGTTLKICFPLLTAEKPKETPKPPESFDTKDKPLGLLIAEREKQ
jgi:uncharacterized protein (TIGR03067 family)